MDIKRVDSDTAKCAKRGVLLYRYSHSRCVKQEVVGKRLWSYRARARLDLVYRDTLHFNVQPLGTERCFCRYLATLQLYVHVCFCARFVFIVLAILRVRVE